MVKWSDFRTKLVWFGSLKYNEKYIDVDEEKFRKCPELNIALLPRNARKKFLNTPKDTEVGVTI
jgi:hypothetical protein